MKNLFTHLDEIRKRIGANSAVVTLDFDGTLAPTVPYYSKSKMSADMHRVLRTCARRFPTAIVTGRMLSDVQKRVRVRGISFAGNHGFEFFIVGKRSQVRIPREKLRALRKARRQLSRALQIFKGVTIEDKRLTFFIHYRHARKADVPAVRRAVFQTVREGGSGQLLHTGEGIEALNIVPAMNRNKGTAARVMFARLRTGRAAVPIFIGDDASDEYAFRTLRGGITVKVLSGGGQKSAARYAVRNVEGVRKFLLWLSELR